MTEHHSRILAPRSLAVVGSAAELSAVVGEIRALGYPWAVWPVVAEAARDTDRGAAAARPGTVAGVRVFASLAELPGAPDLALLLLRGEALASALAELEALGTGAAVCPFLGSAARRGPGAMAVFPGGLLSPVERLPLWPGTGPQAGARRGVALLCAAPEQGPRILSHARGLPLSYALPVGQGDGAGLHELGARLLADERVTALAIQSDTPGDPAALLELGRSAQQHGKALIFLSPGLDPGRAALLRRAGAAHVGGAKALVEALWILHMVGPLPANALSAMACGPGLAAQIEAVGRRSGLRFAPLSPLQQEALTRDVQSGVAVSNPLDCAGLVNSEDGRLARVFAEMMSGEAVLSLAVLRHAGGGAWGRAGLAAAQARQRIGMPLALLALNRAEMTAARAAALLQDGVIPLAGLKPALEALRAVIEIGSLRPAGGPLLMPVPGATAPVTLGGPEARAVLGIAGADPAAGERPWLRFELRADPGFGYLVLLSLPGGPRIGALLPLSPRARRELGERLGCAAPAQATLSAALTAVQDHVQAAQGAVAAMDAELFVDDDSGPRARRVRISAWPETDETRRRSPE